VTQSERASEPMRSNPTWLLAAIISVVGTWCLAGCQEQLPTETQIATEEQQPASEAEEPEQAGSQEPESVSAETPEEVSIGDVERLEGVLESARGETRAEAVGIVTDLLLNHAAPSIRGRAARALYAAATDAAEALVQAGMTDSDPRVRGLAVDSLSHATPSPRLYEAISRLREADDAVVRATAFRAEMSIRLNDPDKESGLRWLADQLGGRKDDASAQAAIACKLRGPEVLPYLIEVLATSEDPVQREVAACVIGLICVGTSPRQQEFAKLSKTEVKQYGLPESKPVNLKGLKPLERAISEDPSPEVRAVAAQGLGFLGQGSSAKVLGKALHDPAEPVRRWAASSLVTVPGDDALKDLSYAATQDESRRVRRAAVRALGWIENKPAVVATLIQATSDASAEVRRAAANELGRIGDPKALEALTSLFEDEDEEVRWAAVLAAGELRDERAAPALANALRDKSPMVANAAERALQKMGIAQRRFGTRDEM